MTTVIVSDTARKLDPISRSQLLFPNSHSQLNFTAILLIDIWLEKSVCIKSTLTAIDAGDEPLLARHEWAIKDGEYQ